MGSTAIYNRHGDEIVEIQIRDSTGRKIDNFSFHAHDKKVSRKVMGLIKEKYDIDVTPEIPTKETVSARNRNKSTEEMLDDLLW